MSTEQQLHEHKCLQSTPLSFSKFFMCLSIANCRCTQDKQVWNVTTPLVLVFLPVCAGTWIMLQFYWALPITGIRFYWSLILSTASLALNLVSLSSFLFYWFFSWGLFRHLSLLFRYIQNPTPNLQVHRLNSQQKNLRILNCALSLVTVLKSCLTHRAYISKRWHKNN